MWKQLKDFVPSRGGTTKYLCLSNVRQGYNIPPLYNSAWEAWQNTEQHKNRTIPTGVDVPLFYSFTATIDGVRKNWGHINVRLSNGTIWNDGITYPNLKAFEIAYSNVSYVGWGESVNKVKVIKQGEPMVTNPNHLDILFVQFLGRKPTLAEKTKYLGKSHGTILEYLYPKRVNVPALIKARETQATAEAGRVKAMKDKIINFVRGVK